MPGPRAVLDTNVVVSGLRSRRGASFALLSELGKGRFEVVVSVPLVLEYEAALMGMLPPGLTGEDVQVFLDYICGVASHQEIFYLWRPLLRDPKDDLVLEVAVASGALAVVTHNRRHFAGAEQFGVAILGPLDFLRRTGALP